jgi:hypothetical protein
MLFRSKRWENLFLINLMNQFFSNQYLYFFNEINKPVYCESLFIHHKRFLGVKIQMFLKLQSGLTKPRKILYFLIFTMIK